MGLDDKVKKVVEKSIGELRNRIAECEEAGIHIGPIKTLSKPHHEHTYSPLTVLRQCEYCCTFYRDKPTSDERACYSQQLEHIGIPIGPYSPSIKPFL